MVTELPFAALPVSQADVTHEYGPDSALRDGVVAGDVEEMTHVSTVFPGTARKIWIHRAADHDPSRESAVMFFNDGWWYLDPELSVRAAIVPRRGLAPTRSAG